MNAPLRGSGAEITGVISVGADGAEAPAVTVLTVARAPRPVLGLGAGGIFTLAMIVPLAITDAVDDNRRLTASMLCYGYLLASTGPLLITSYEVSREAQPRRG